MLNVCTERDSAGQVKQAKNKPMRRNSKPEKSQMREKDFTLGHKPARDSESKPEDKPQLSKTDVRRWRERLFKRSGDDWHVQIAFGGHQERFPLKTPNKDAAASKAREIYLSLHTLGWDETRKRFKPWVNKVEQIDSPTVGQFLEAVEKYSGINPITLKSYTRKFRRLVAGVRAIAGDKSRYDRRGGSSEWRLKVDKVQLADLKPAAISKWKADYVSAKRGNTLRQHRAEATAQSILRNSKSLFTDKVFKKLADANMQLQMPLPLPFDGVEIGETVNHRYTSRIDAEQLARDAQKELPAEDPELFKIFLLAFGVGLRRGEIDRLTWPQFNWSKDQINVEVTAHGGAKTHSSIAAVDVDPELMKLFRQFKEKATDEFVIESSVKPLPGANWHHYRCNCAFMRLNAWLRAKGVDVPNPIHTLRKEFGTLICQKFGIFAASEALRHTDIRLTRAHYVDKRGRIHLEVGKMLGGKK